MFLKDQVFFYSFTFLSIFCLYFFILNFLILKDFGHVDRLFIIRNMKDLGSQWTIVDYDRNVHNVTYNMNIHTPMITQGWNDLISFYADESDKLVVFKYFGNSSFQLHVSKRVCDSTLKANFFNHLSIRRPLHTSNLKHFEVQLSTYYCRANHLVSFIFLGLFIYMDS